MKFNFKNTEHSSAISTYRDRKSSYHKRQRREERSHTTSSTVINDTEEDATDFLDGIDDSHVTQTGEIRCVCGATENVLAPKTKKKVYVRDGWVGCGRCNVRQHTLCVMYGFVEGAIPDEYFCEVCEPDIHKGRKEKESLAETGSPLPIQIQSGPETALIEESRYGLPNAELRLQASSVELNSVVDNRLATAREKIKDLEAEVLELKLDLDIRAATVAQKDQEISALRQAQKQRDYLKRLPVEELMTQNIDMSKKLHASINNREQRTKFTKLDGTSREWFGSTKIDEGFTDLYSESQQILCRRDSEIWEFTPSLVQHCELRQLVSKCLAIDLETSSQMQAAMHRLLSFSPDGVVRALATSALLEWVFETGFPQFDEEQSQLFSSYRELLAEQGIAVHI
jgi:hypothetical protein